MEHQVSELQPQPNHNLKFTNKVAHARPEQAHQDDRKLIRTHFSMAAFSPEHADTMSFSTKIKVQCWPPWYNYWAYRVCKSWRHLCRKVSLLQIGGGIWSVIGCWSKSMLTQRKQMWTPYCKCEWPVRREQPPCLCIPAEQYTINLPFKYRAWKLICVLCVALSNTQHTYLICLNYMRSLLKGCRTHAVSIHLKYWWHLVTQVVGQTNALQCPQVCTVLFCCLIDRGDWPGYGTLLGSPTGPLST